MTARRWLAPLLFLIACSSDVDSPPTSPDGGLPTGEAAASLLVRASLDLSGARPERALLDRVAESPEALETALDDLLANGNFGLRIRDFFAISYRTRFGDNLQIEEGVLGARAETGEAALKLYEEAALQDLPMTHVVTSDHGWVGPALAELEPVSGYDAAKGGWQKVTYTDGRSAAGVLTTSSLWARYETGESNRNRSRANTVSRILLCENYLHRPVDFPRDIDLTNAQEIENAISENAGCQACHSTLDPIAAFFGDINYEPGYQGFDFVPDASFVPPVDRAYFGAPGSTLADLGEHVADDPRFSRCIVERVYEAMIGRPPAREDVDAISFHDQTFRDSGLVLRALIRSILRDPVYAGQDDGARRGLLRKRMSPEVFELAVKDVTGFTAAVAGSSEDWPLLRDDVHGLHVLGGGLGAVAGDHPPPLPNATEVMVHRLVAERAAIASLRSGRLTELIGSALSADNYDRVAADGLIDRFLPTATTEHRDAIEGLWNSLRAKGLDAPSAWTAVVVALIRDPDFITY